MFICMVVSIPPPPPGYVLAVNEHSHADILHPLLLLLCFVASGRINQKEMYVPSVPMRKGN